MVGPNHWPDKGPIHHKAQPNQTPLLYFSRPFPLYSLLQHCHGRRRSPALQSSSSLHLQVLFLNLHLCFSKASNLCNIVVTCSDYIPYPKKLNRENETDCFGWNSIYSIRLLLRWGWQRPRRFDFVKRPQVLCIGRHRRLELQLVGLSLRMVGREFYIS